MRLASLVVTALLAVSAVARADTLSASFAHEFLGKASIDAVLAHPDGSVYAAGNFVKVNGERHAARLVRILPDGSRDVARSYHFNGPIRKLILFPDGRVCVLGDFTMFDNEMRPGIVILGANGAPDPTFDPGSFSMSVQDVAMTVDGKVLVAGTGYPKESFENGRPTLVYPGTVVRLLANGTVDPSFSPPQLQPHPHDFSSRYDAVGAHVVLPLGNGTILVGGDFRNVDGQDRDFLVILDSTGAVVEHWQSPVILSGEGAWYGNPAGVFAGAAGVDGSIFLGGSFAVAAFPTQRAAVKLTPNAVVDPSFRVDFASEFGPSSVAVVRGLSVSAGNIAITGDFESVDENWTNGAAIVDAFGRYVPSGGLGFPVSMLADGRIVALPAAAPGASLRKFSPALEPLDGFAPLLLAPTSPSIVVPLSNDRVAVAGNTIREIDSVTFEGFAVLGPGGVDSQVAVDPPTGVAKIVAGLGDRLVLAGSFTTVDGLASKNLAIIDDSAEEVIPFGPSVSPDSLVRNAVLLPSGKVFVTGSFSKIGTIPRNGAAIFDVSDDPPVLDKEFDSDFGNFFFVEHALGLANGEILIAGWIDGNAGAFREDGILKLDASGSLVEGYRPVASLEPVTFYEMAFDPLGRLVVGGWFDATEKRLVRLLPDGGVDPSFDGSSVSWLVGLFVQADGRIVVAGSFESGGMGIRRLNADGTPDASLSLPAASYAGFAFRAPDTLHAWGWFTSLAGASRTGLAAFDLSTSVPPIAVLTPVSHAGYPGERLEIILRSVGESEQIEWFKDGAPLSSGGRSVSFDSLQDVNAGLYEARVHGPGGMVRLYSSITADGTRPPDPTPTPTPDPPVEKPPTLVFEYPRRVVTDARRFVVKGAVRSSEDSELKYRVGGGDWQTVTKRGKWRIPVKLRPGRNVVRIRVLDAQGAVVERRNLAVVRR